MKNFLIAVGVLLVAGCTSLSDWIPEKYDSVEFSRLAELHVIATSSMAKSQPVWCHPAELSVLHYQAEVLSVYARHTLKDNIAEIYLGIADLASELVQREEPSEAYCRIKRNNIAELTERALAVFGNRSKS